MRFKIYVLAFAFALFSPMTTSAAVTFVASDDELNVALVLVDRDAIDSLAVSQSFYLGTAKQTKDRIRGLIAGVEKKPGKSIYVYGQAFDTALAVELIGPGTATCHPVNVLGKIYRRQNSINVCDGVSSVRTDVEIRRGIQSMDRDLKKE